MHGIGGVSRSGRVRKKSAKLIEMEVWDAPDQEGRPHRKSKSSDESEQETEKKVAPIKLPIKVPSRKPQLSSSPTKQIYFNSEKGRIETGHIEKNLDSNNSSLKMEKKSGIFPATTDELDRSIVTTMSSSSSSSESDEMSEEEPPPINDFRQMDQRFLPPKKKIKKDVIWLKRIVPFEPKKITLGTGSSSLRKKKKKKMKKKLEKGVKEKFKQKKNNKKTSVSSKSLVGSLVTSDQSSSTFNSETPFNPLSFKREFTMNKSKSTICTVPKSKKNFRLPNGKKIKDQSKVRPMSAYMLWCRENRKRIVRENPQLDFHLISKKMGSVWQSLSAKEKMAWKKKANQYAKLQRITGGASFIMSEKCGPSAGQFPSSGSESSKSNLSSIASNISSIYDPKTKLPRTTPLDVAAYLKLLGDSLSIIGQRLTEHEGQIAVSGTLSVLLDSTLCALGPLMCLTSQVPELNGCEQTSLAQILDNIAYVMPGL
ncbi:uncharacterized protein LOC143241142 [Tachypleus tridentatus]|uniref:uncharacterized protein LOC143241142 n=1 Tax=Tachypleus tridentatus TaxID=6853 RepID=UPI003FD39666